jgi:hypothetical protein
MIHFNATQPTLGAGSAATNIYGFAAQSSLAVATNTYGFYGNIASGSNRYNVYMAGTADNYFAGNVGIGTASPGVRADISGVMRSSTWSLSGTGVTGGTAAFSAGTVSTDANWGFYFRAGTSSSAIAEYSFRNLADVERMQISAAGNVGIGGTASAFAKVEVLGTLPTSSNATNAFRAAGTIPSGTTSDANLFVTVASTAAASFTLTNLRHYNAFFLSKGASSAITNQYGFFADASLTEATNNYGFYSNIASGSNRWNFYAAGTAANYMAGTLQTGSTIGVGAATPATSGAGITFPGTQSASSDANTLDDYEEGTYTPTFGGTSSNPTVTYTTQSGAYTKIGNMVYLYARIVISAVAGGSGALQISVPFTPRSGLYQAISCTYGSLDLPANTVELTSILNGDIATISFVVNYDNATVTDLATSALTASTTVTLSGCYVV